MVWRKPCAAWRQFEAACGEVVALLGRNGGGKTTTLRAVVGTLAPHSSVRVRGEETIALPAYKIARLGVGYVPEERGIFSTLTVKENLLLPPVLRSGGFALGEIYALFPNLRQRLASQGSRVSSGGEQQMLAIARIMRTGIACLLLDVPSEGLAPIIVAEIGRISSRCCASAAAPWCWWSRTSSLRPSWLTGTT